MISHSPDPERIVAAAIKQCRSNVGADKFLMELNEHDIKRLIRSCIEMGHLSPIEHVSFTFLIEGISRVTSHQLVRHRIASYSQQSHRAVKIDSENFIIPPSIENNPEAKSLFLDAMSRCMDCYNNLLKLGVSREDARYIVPQAVGTSIVVTMNARELLHFFSLRLMVDSQWEIRDMARLMLREVLKVAPTIFEKFKDYA